MSYRSFFYSILFCSIYTWGDQTIVYQSSLEGKDTQTKWVIDENPEKIAITGQNKGNDIQLHYSPNFTLEHYVEKESGTPSFEVHKVGSQLEVKNNTKSKILKIGNLHWIQEFKFGFQPFLKSSDTKHIFAIVHSKDNSFHEMVATKEKIEKVVIAATEYEAQKLKITLTGFKKRFWKAEVWFDLKTHLMLKYKSNEGPGTPPIEVTLIEGLK